MFVEVIVNGIAALVEITLQLLLLLFKSLFRLGRAGDRRLPAPDRQRHLTAGLLGLAVLFTVVALVGGLLWLPV